MCSVLYNALKNAIEGARMEENQLKRVYIEVTSEGSEVTVTILNTANAPEIKEGKLMTTKKDKKNHGIGSDNIRNAMDECGGYIEWKYENGYFYTTLIFNCDDQI